MKKFLLTLMVAIVAAVACQNEPSFDYAGSDAVDVTISLNVPDLNVTRSGETAMDSAKGAIDNFTDAALWDKFDVRYVMEIFDVTPGYENLNEPVKERMFDILDEYNETTFELRLIPNRTYKFVVWADFVADGSYQVADYSTVEGLNYDITDLRNITRKEWRAMDECQDAYFIQKDLTVTRQFSDKLTLKRPFGKLRVIASDVDELNIGSVPYQMDVTFYNHPTFTSLNAITGKVVSEVATKTYSYTIDKSAPYSKGWDRLDAYQTLFADYLYASDDASEVNFTIKVSEENGREISNHDFNTQIPLQRNYLTTIIGNLLTTATEIKVSIDDNFTGEYINEIDTPATNLTSWSTATTDVDGNLVYTLNNGSADFTLVVNKSAAENGGLKAGTYGYAADATQADTFTITGLQTETRALVDVEVENGTMVVAANEDGTTTIDLVLNLNYGKDSDGKYIIYTTHYAFTGTVTTIAPEPTKLATPSVTGSVSNYKSVNLSWEAVENAEYYTVSYDDKVETVEVTQYTATLDNYDTTYTFSVTAHPADGSKLYLASDADVVELTTEADPYIYLKPNSNWVKDNARFAVYTWDSESVWYDMKDSDSDGIYEVLKTNLKSNVIFCRMNPGSTANDWNNKWNQTSDLTLPTDGNNLYTVKDGTWDNGGGTWSKKQ